MADNWITVASKKHRQPKKTSNNNWSDYARSSNKKPENEPKQFNNSRSMDRNLPNELLNQSKAPLRSSPNEPFNQAKAPFRSSPHEPFNQSKGPIRSPPHEPLNQSKGPIRSPPNEPLNQSQSTNLSSTNELLPTSKSSIQNLSNETVHQLNDTWVLWYHDLKSSDWSELAYDKLFSFNTVEDFWILYNNINDLTNGMYYLMRNGIPPMWEHEKNINGGAWTFKIDKRNLNNFWKDLSCYCVGETVCSQPQNIVGLSISPKIRYATVRVWTSDKHQNVSLFKKIAEESDKGSVKIDFNEARFTANKEASI